MATIDYQSVNKEFSDGTRALGDFTLGIGDGEFMVLVGPSGCGKSTALRLLAGLEEPTSGEIRIGERIVNGLPPQQRDIAMVFQNYALYPHKTVRKNLEFPLRMAGWPADRIRRQVAETARLLELEPLLERRPGALSGGQRQRVAMGRALVREPAVFLLDEPLSNLDAQLRGQMRREITALQQRLRTTTIYVTHDQVEAMTMGSRLAVMNRGQLQQVGSPREIYDRPANMFVAAFIGSPRMNLFESAFASGPDGGRGFRLGDQVVTAPEIPAMPRGASGQKIFAGLRPEAFQIADADSREPRVQVRVLAVEPLGHEQIVYFETAGLKPVAPEIAARDSSEPPMQAMAARLPAKVRIAAGESVSLAVDLAQVHFFDESGRAIPRQPVVE